jgi:glycosyltransferase involved in cell wall biosynthesis
MPAVRDVYPEARCVVGGRGGMRSELESLVDDRGLDDAVSLLGYVPAEELNLWMNAADVFVLPSYSESFGVVQLEAMACGTPVVATRNGGSEEVIPGENHGLLVDGPEDVDALASAVVGAFDREWDDDAIADYAAGYTWERVCADIADLYRDVLGIGTTRGRDGTARDTDRSGDGQPSTRRRDA